MINYKYLHIFNAVFVLEKPLRFLSQKLCALIFKLLRDSHIARIIIYHIGFIKRRKPI